MKEDIDILKLLEEARDIIWESEVYVGASCNRESDEFACELLEKIQKFFDVYELLKESMEKP